MPVVLAIVCGTGLRAIADWRFAFEAFPLCGELLTTRFSMGFRHVLLNWCIDKKRRGAP